MITINTQAEKLLKEPAFYLFRHQGLLCCILRNTFLGTLSGYVAVPKEHPFFEKDYDELPVSVHGGLTYGDTSLGGIEKDVFPDPLYWFGFDTAHGGDIWPYEPTYEIKGEQVAPFAISNSWPGNTYKDFNYVKEQVISLADQLAKAAIPSKKRKIAKP